MVDPYYYPLLSGDDVAARRQLQPAVLEPMREYTNKVILADGSPRCRAGRPKSWELDLFASTILNGYIYGTSAVRSRLRCPTDKSLNYK